MVHFPVSDRFLRAAHAAKAPTMHAIEFNWRVDVPLIAAVAIGAIWNFNLWANERDPERFDGLSRRLPSARVRLIALLATILLACWLSNIAVWPLFVVVLAVGGLLLLVAGDEQVGAMSVLSVGWLVREWCFGFPHLILHPPVASENASVTAAEMSGLVGKTGTTMTPLNPSGDAEIDGVKIAVSSADGRFIESGAEVVVTSCQNGWPYVREHRLPNGDGPTPAVPATEQ